MGEQAGGNTRYKGPGSEWKSSWKGRVMFSEFCCFEGFDRASVFYEEPGGALDITPADGEWINVIVTLDAPIPDTVEALVVRNGTPPEGWEIVAVGSLNSGGIPVVTFIFRVYDGAGVAASLPISYVYNVDTLAADSVGFRISAFFYPTTVGFPLGQINLGVEGVASAVATPLAAAYSNAAPDLILGAGVGAQEDWIAPRSICGLAGGEGDFSAGDTALRAHQSWLRQVAAESQMVAMPATVSGVAVPGYTADNGWRGNNPYLSPGTAPDPLAPFIGATDLVETGAGDLTTVCGTVNFANPLDL